MKLHIFHYYVQLIGGIKLNQENKIKEWSNPTPAGLVALAVACFCFFAILSGKVTHDAMPLLGT
ncbi:hypothetical protein [Psychrilyobacter sp.]|uniref:hypothetical protein n=1 Tax=Psychrilyobacter sp. TaxID=2586924 RepID=UPI00301A826B